MDRRAREEGRFGFGLSEGFGFGLTMSSPRDAARLSRDLSEAALALLCDPFALGMLSCRLAAFRTMFNFLMT